MSGFSVSDVLDSVFGSKEPTTFDQAKDNAVSDAKDKPAAKTVADMTSNAKLDADNNADDKPVSNSENKQSQENPVKKTPGVKIHVTKEYVKKHGSTIVGTKGDDVFVVDADVKTFKIKGNGGKDKLVMKKPKPSIEFPKLPNKK